MTRRLSVTYLLVGMLVMSGPLAHSADKTAGPATQADLDRAVEKALGQEDAARGAITSLLQRDEVRSMAAGYGLDARRAEAAVSTLQDDELQRLSTMAASADMQIAGGDQVLRISLVALLLVVIIVILLVR
jgi:predicted nucleic acid-binding Zn ribbon protein